MTRVRAKQKDITIIRVDGTEEQMVIRKWSEIAPLINAGNGLDTINLRNGKIMLVDDLGHVQGIKEKNIKASKLYLKICKPGTAHFIVGDVALVTDSQWNAVGEV